MCGCSRPRGRADGTLARVKGRNTRIPQSTTPTSGHPAPRRVAWRRAWVLGALLVGSALAAASARTVAIGGVVQSAGVASRMNGPAELLAVWTLPRLGVSVRNDASDLRLQLPGRELRWRPGTGWQALGFAPLGTPLNALPAPQILNGSLHVSLDALRVLGVRVIADTPTLLDFAAPTAQGDTLPPSADLAPVAGTPAVPPKATVPAPAPTPMPTPAPVTPTPTPVTPTAPTGPALTVVRVSRTLYRTVEVQRVVLELSGPAAHTVTREQNGLSITLPGVSAGSSSQTLPSGDTLSVTAGAQGARVTLGTGGGRSEIFTLDDPHRVVIDTTTYTDTRVPPPVNPDALPAGVTYRQTGRLHLLSFDPQKFQPRVVTAPQGKLTDVAQLVKSVGGVAGVNGGYFDPGSALPVDFVAVGGLMTAGSLEKRGTLAFTSQGDALFGYPRPRYFLQGAFGQVMVNAVRASPNPGLLTAFVGDGRTSVGADTLITLYVQPGATSVQRAFTGVVTPPAGVLAFTFDPVRYPQLPRAAGQPLTVSLNYQAHDQPWETAVDALSAGPMMVQAGKVVIDPRREDFNTLEGVWRPTRQVAFGLLSGQPTIAYFEHGTPEAFAAALAGAGFRDAVRLDSGSSATAYLSGGYLNLGGYLNTVWSRPVANAIVFVPRGNAKDSVARK